MVIGYRNRKSDKWFPRYGQPKFGEKLQQQIHVKLKWCPFLTHISATTQPISKILIPLERYGFVDVQKKKILEIPPPLSEIWGSEVAPVFAAVFCCCRYKFAPPLKFCPPPIFWVTPLPIFLDYLKFETWKIYLENKINLTEIFGLATSPQMWVRKHRCRYTAMCQMIAHIVSWPYGWEWQLNIKECQLNRSFSLGFRHRRTYTLIGIFFLTVFPRLFYWWVLLFA